jgi:hypothetical protein
MYAYAHGLPLVMMDVTRQVMTAAGPCPSETTSRQLPVHRRCSSGSRQGAVVAVDAVLTPAAACRHEPERASARTEWPGSSLGLVATCHDLGEWSGSHFREPQCIPSRALPGILRQNFRSSDA